MPKRLVGTAVISGDILRKMYEEAPSGIDLRKFGEIQRCVKVSDVVFNVYDQEWIAVDRVTKKIVARDETRKGCVRKEHVYYSKRVSRSRFPRAGEF